MCSVLGIERSVTAAYQPQTNGLNEKTNYNIKRSKVQTTTTFSQFVLMYGKEAVFPAGVPVDLPLSNTVLPVEKNYVMYMEERKSRESIEEATLENIAKLQEKHKVAYAKRMQKKHRDLHYKVGGEVLLYNIRKRGRKGGRIELDFLGTYIIKELCGNMVKLANPDNVTLKE
ncbi:SH3-containing GRB2 3-interacting 1 [Pelobates cultripes]|uniref:SH3-containing GRB2 3-interacting 1 n=1 Tax=Pelobates cultripes TaxID=61616 RepID=A0AAD1S7B6_PELCU|nr:SH3-containing GRB2 3-interacting 1 [Pelobates cultripes]